MFICTFCSKECKNLNSFRNHERLCPSNPNRKYKNGMLGKAAWNKDLKGDPRCSKIGLKGHSHTEETKKRLSEIAKARGFGGYRENAGRSKKYKVLDSYGKLTTLQSSYELICSEILDNLGIKWLRPKALKYDGRNYFADFYLPEKDLWLDPKNVYKAKLDVEKISKVIEQNNVKLYVLLEDNLTEEYIKQLCS